MDYILKCYFNDYFDSLPRHSLHDRRKRREMVQYISTLIEGVRRGQLDANDTAGEAITSIIRYHELMRSDNSSICLMGKYHNVLYVALKLCYLWQVKDSTIVSSLLQSIYSCEKTFERLFVGAIFGTKAPHYIAGWKSDFDNQEENLRATVYFMHHANNACLTFNYENNIMCRFIDVPIESCGKCTPLTIALQLGLPDKLMIFLRYGACLDYGNCEVTSIEHILDRLMEFNHVYPYNLVACLQLLLRVVPTITFPDKHSPEIGGSTRLIVTEKYGDLLEDGLIPCSRCGINVPELKHLSRCVIRQRLWENFNLPDGIRKLPLPEKLWRYLDILED